MLRFSFVLILFSIASFNASCAEQGQGRVNINGSILSAPCALDFASRYQTIDMHSQPLSEIISENSGISSTFYIRLINCTLLRHGNDDKLWKYFTITFDGLYDHQNFGLEGDAKGVAVNIRDADGNVAQPGEPMPLYDINPGNSTLKYTIRLVGNGNEVRAGTFNGSVRYKMDYY